MDSMRHDLREALDEVRSEAVRASTTAADQHSSGPKRPDNRICMKCGSPSAPEDKLRYCGRCEAAFYCSKQCAKDDWAEHRQECKSMRRTRDQAIADYEALGGRKQDFNQATRDVESFVSKVPGLSNEIQLLAWTHRGESPFIHAYTAGQCDADGSGVRVKMIPRTFWDADPRFFDSHPVMLRERLRQVFNSSFDPNKTYICISQETTSQAEIFASRTFHDEIIHGVEIVEALTAATGNEDLSNAFAWLVTFFSAHAAQELLQLIRVRSTSVHGILTQHDSSVSTTSRALNNEVAYLMFCALDLEFDVRLTGLRSAAHLNGSEGYIRGKDPADHERWRILLDDGSCVSARAANLEHIRRGIYKRARP